MYEHRHQPLLTRPRFLRRVVRNACFAAAAVVFALGIGVLGYHALGGLGWVDSLLNASMILGGMGPVDSLKSDVAKVFASVYALFSGLFFIGVAGVLFAPVFHRFLHRFHLEVTDEKSDDDK